MSVSGNTEIRSNVTSCPILPDEIVSEVLSRVELATVKSLSLFSLVCKSWNKAATEVIHIKIGNDAFGCKKWDQYFGKGFINEEDYQNEVSTLPAKAFRADCHKFNQIFGVDDSLMLIWLPKGLTLKNLHEVVKSHIPQTGIGIIDVNYNTLSEISNSESQWVMLTKDVLPATTNLNFANQKKLLGNLGPEYEIPETLTVATCIYSYFFETENIIFGQNPSNITLCNDEIQEIEGVKNVCIGMFNPTLEGLYMFPIDTHVESESFGLAVMRRY